MSQSGLLDVAGSNPQIPTSFVTDSGVAIPIGNVLEILGGTNVTTSGSGNTVTIDVSGTFAETITGNDLVALSPVAGNWNIFGAGNIITSGSGNTLTATLTGLTPRAVQLGATSTTLAQSNLGQNGQVLIGATGANPAFASLTSIGGTVTFTSGANSLNLEAGGSVPIQFTTDSGIAVPVLGNINIIGTPGAASAISSNAINIITSGAGDTVTISQTLAQTMTGYRRITFADSPYTADADDYYISVDSTGGSVTVLLPNAPNDWRMFIVKDALGQSDANNIMITTPGGIVLLDGATSYLIDTNYESLDFVFNSTDYEAF